MATYLELKQKAEKLMAEAEQMRQKEIDDVIAEIREKMKAYGLTAQDIGGWPEDLTSPLWTTAAGLAMYSAKLKVHRPPKRMGGGLMGLVVR